MDTPKPNALVVLGPTAAGKTALGVALAAATGGEVISADSRQVYRGLNIGSGKDLEEYKKNGVCIPYHLIDIVDLDQEFNVFEYQKRFFECFVDLCERSVLPVVVGGTGLYLEAVLKGYRMVEVPHDPGLREELSARSDDELVQRLRALKPTLHNTTDLNDRDRIIRAIEIEVYTQHHEPEPTPPLHPLIFGTRWDRKKLHRRIEHRLRERMRAGMIDEVRALIDQGVSVEKLRFLGLEYRFIAEYLQGEISSEDELFTKLNSAIRNFAKRQETWFRRMARRGAILHWIDEANAKQALDLARQHGIGIRA
ncbi:MAG: tRNA (adenosine(37)-N6)-dimethylallyltransferase MiaA [Candidatus Hydrogenedentes bacterium]|nr:tRNA (adenosine(37)-N6)-dimethylallyltransferase MiaA [Candidatus Hydrogenedentota bacterium]